MIHFFWYMEATAVHFINPSCTWNGLLNVSSYVFELLKQVYSRT